MRLTKAEFCNSLDALKRMWDEEEQLISVLKVNPEWRPGEWINTFYDLFISLCELETDPIYGNTLDWYIWETDWGADSSMNRITIVDTGKVWIIDCVETLYDYLMMEELKEWD